MPEVGSSCEFVNRQLGQEAFHSPAPCIYLAGGEHNYDFASETCISA